MGAQRSGAEVVKHSLSIATQSWPLCEPRWKRCAPHIASWSKPIEVSHDPHRALQHVHHESDASQAMQGAADMLHDQIAQLEMAHQFVVIQGHSHAVTPVPVVVQGLLSSKSQTGYTVTMTTIVEVSVHTPQEVPR
ncbi:hypothetical protein GS425_12770 [Rhodococcus hoagii]|nr:hypothetical protein [Prescottella equi]